MRTAWKTAHEKERRGEQGAILVVEAGSPDKIIARVPPLVPRAERQVIADLLAGAPEMYEACKKIVERHNDRFKDGLTGHCFCEECLWLMDVIYICDGGYARDMEDRAKAKAKAKRKAKRLAAAMERAGE